MFQCFTKKSNPADIYYMQHQIATEEYDGVFLL